MQNLKMFPKKRTLVHPLLPRKGEKVAGSLVHYASNYVTLIEDDFGFLFDKGKKVQLVKRFTWKNHNKISVSVITYGARITSIKMPDRAGNVEEIVLGFDNLDGYLYYDKYKLSATIGRTSTKIPNSTCVLDGKQIWLKANDGQHHIGGGPLGFDHVNWEPYVSNNVLQLSHVARDGEGGYPGDLFVQIAFELTEANEFKVCITGKTTKTTPVDITNYAYFNLAGHSAGEAELRKHEIIINANCYTPMDENNEFPTGALMNVVNTRFNFQVPKLLRNVMGMGLEAAYDQNFCVNRGVHQGEAFVARLIHPFKGRVLEVYSNQYGVNFCNGCHIPDRYYNIPREILLIKPSLTSLEMRENQEIFIIISRISEYFRLALKLQPEQYFSFLHSIMNKLLGGEDSHTENISSSSANFTSSTPMLDFDVLTLLKPIEVQFLAAIKELLPTITKDMTYDVVMSAIDDVFQRHNKTSNANAINRSYSFVNEIINKQIYRISMQEGTEDKSSATATSSSRTHSSTIQVREKSKAMYKCGAPTPVCYKPNKIIGRGGVVYERYGAFSLRTQCYPNARSMERFPKPILRPNETYNHTIVYKFWIQTSDRNKGTKGNPCQDPNRPT